MNEWLKYRKTYRSAKINTTQMHFPLIIGLALKGYHINNYSLKLKTYL
jgi:hypothetical protein